MSHSLNLEVTVEGVETIERLQLLCAKSCHELQELPAGPTNGRRGSRSFGAQQRGETVDRGEIGRRPARVGEASTLIYI
jgi:hypothetical protein